MDPNHVVNHAYCLASYLFQNNSPIQSGETVDGIGPMEISKGAYNGDVNTNMHSFNRQEKFWTYALEFMPPVSGRKAKEICSKPFISGQMVDGIGPDGNIQKKHSMGDVHTNTHSFNRQGKFPDIALGFISGFREEG